MRRRPVRSSLLSAGAFVLGGLVPATTMAAPSAYDEAFVAAFAAACVPQRMSYPGTVETARAEGWQTADRAAHPELDALMALSEAAAKDPELEEATFDYTLLTKPVMGRAHFLVVTRSTFVIGERDDPLNPWVYLGCYLYDFDAASPIDPSPVTELIGKPIGIEHSDDTVTAYVWGPSCAMPRTGDTYLTFVPEGSPHGSQTVFSGLVLKMETSEPDEGEVVPETYC